MPDEPTEPADPIETLQAIRVLARVGLEAENPEKFHERTLQMIVEACDKALPQKRRRKPVRSNDA